MSQTQSELTLEQLKAAVERDTVAIRTRSELQPAGGPGDKVFPPTYPEGPYALERRRLGSGDVVDCVLLDSVASQANRMEEALRQACDRNEIDFPRLEIDLSGEFPEIGRITSLDAPHRIADAVFRDSLLGGVPFRESPEGRAFEGATVQNATPLYELCPTALIFGNWDSTSFARGGRGNKFARVLTAEIIGIDIQRGVGTASRLDPLGIENVGDVYRAAQGGWTLDAVKAEKGSDGGSPVTIRPSEVNLGNIAPSIIPAGGVTMRHAIQTTVLSLAGLRRLRFPDERGGTTQERDWAGRTVLATLALAAVALCRQQGYDLRSRCVLVPTGPSNFEMVRNDGESISVTLDASSAIANFSAAADAAGREGLHWREGPIRLTPSEDLLELVRRSRRVLTADPEGQ